jgi:hypothetical protein
LGKKGEEQKGKCERKTKEDKEKERKTNKTELKFRVK